MNRSHSKSAYAEVDELHVFGTGITQTQVRCTKNLCPENL